MTELEEKLQDLLFSLTQLMELNLVELVVSSLTKRYTSESLLNYLVN